MSSLASVLSALGEQLGIPGLAFDHNNCCRLVFDDRQMLELRAAGAQRRLVLSSRLGQAGAQWPSGAERKLLQANLWRAGTGGGWFALDEHGQACLQQDVVIEDGGIAELLMKIEAMLNSLDLWERHLQEGVEASSPVASPLRNFPRV